MDPAGDALSLPATSASGVQPRVPPNQSPTRVGGPTDPCILVVRNTRRIAPMQEKTSKTALFCYQPDYEPQAVVGRIDLHPTRQH